MSKLSPPSIFLDSRAVRLPASYTPAALPRRSVPFPWHNSCITSPASPADPLSLSVLEITWLYLKPVPGFFVVVFGRRFLLLSIVELVFDPWMDIAQIAFLSTPPWASSSHQHWKSIIGSFCQLHPHSLSHSVALHLLHLWLPDPCTSDLPCWFYDILICLYLKFQRNSHMDPRCWSFNSRRCFLITQMWYVSKILALFSLWIT